MSSTQQKWTWLSLIVSVIATLCVGAGLYMAAHSPLFLVQVVEIGDLPENAPVDAQEITRLAGVPVGKVNLFQLDLARIEKNIRSNPWVREVRIQKKFPQTLSVSVQFRQPQALIETSQGGLAYVDREGTVFGRATTQQSALPVLSGLNDASQIQKTLRFIDAWDRRLQKSELSSMTWDVERGYRAMVVYPLGPSSGGVYARARVDLGQNIDVPASADPQLAHLSSVIEYLKAKSIAARQIWADSGKKIVVRTSRGS
ncbi:MAG: FtsQ-type POTRA domain-containing protein [Oligoflexia bacterium]|nr:FtsQ-type POTRA domain-containing protein [Oligoflexia bacterium]